MKKVLLLWLFVVMVATVGMAQTPPPATQMFVNIAGVPTAVTSTLTSGQLTVPPPAILAKCVNGSLIVDCDFSGGGGGSGFPIVLGSTSIASGSTTTTLAGFDLISSAAFAGTGAKQTVLNLVQGTPADAPPAHAIQFGAPTTVTASYTAFLPTLAPTDAGGDVWVVPNGGGTGTWQPYGAGVCGSGNIPCTNTANAFTAAQTITITDNTNAALTLTNAGTGPTISLLGSNSAGASIYMQTVGQDSFALFAGNSGFGPNTLTFYDNTASSPNLMLGMHSGGSSTGYLVTSQLGRIGWIASGDETVAPDTALSRDAAATVDVGNGTQGDKSGTLKAAHLFAGSSEVTVTAATTVNAALCLKSAGPPVVLGVCSSVVGAGGACTCN